MIPVIWFVSNNVCNDNVKAFLGEKGTTENAAIEASKELEAQILLDGGAAGINLVDKTWMQEKMKKSTGKLSANEYIGYLTNTQGGIYLAYKQLVDFETATYTETLVNNGVPNEVTVARVPAAIILSDGGANFAFNPMGTIKKLGENGEEQDVEGNRIEGVELDQLKDDTKYKIHPYTYAKWMEEFKAYDVVTPSNASSLPDRYRQDDFDGWGQLDKYYRLHNTADEKYNFPDPWTELESAHPQYGNIGDE